MSVEAARIEARMALANWSKYAGTSDELAYQGNKVADALRSLLDATPAPVAAGEGMVMVSKCPFCLGLSRYSGNPKDVFCAEHFAQFERTTDA